MRTTILCLCCCLTAVACAPESTTPERIGPFLDATNDETWKTSVRRVRSALVPKERAAFDKALQRMLGDSAINTLLASSGSINPTAPAQQTPRDFLHRLNAKDVIANGSEVKTTVFDEDLAANEELVIMHMRAIAAAQDKLRASGAIDTNEDGEGEYGFFTELTGKAKLRVGPSAESSAVLAEPLLSALFSRIVQRRASVAGYRFQMFLPGEKAAPQPEDNFGGGVAAKIESQLAEKAWCCIAWPEIFGETGRRVFFINQESRLLAHANESGTIGGDPLLGFRSDEKRLDGGLDFDPEKPVKGSWTDDL